MFDPSATKQKPNSISSSVKNKETKSKKNGHINESGQNEKETKKKDVNNVSNKRSPGNDNSQSNKKRKLSKSKVSVHTVDTDLTEDYMSKLKEYENMFELPPITKNRPRKPVHYDVGYFKALRKYVKSEEDISVANR